MRSNKEHGLRLVAALAWIAVLVCAAYASVNFTRKDWRDYTPIEKIGYFTPNEIRWETLLDGGTEVASVSGTTGSFVIVFPANQPESACLVKVGAEFLREEFEPASEMGKAIVACLDRAERSGDLDAGVRLSARNLRRRLLKRS
jgi:hypothetical protein